MAERITGRPWSTYEDILLSKAVAESDGEADWKLIAQRVPGRTNKACRKVCFSRLSPIFSSGGSSETSVLAMASLAISIDQEIGLD